jgi:4-hydroxybenzoate polyprenyltransferase
MVGRVYATVRLIHPLPASLVVGLSAVLLVIVHGGSPGIGVLLRGTGMVAASQVVVGALNDYLDRDSDAFGQADKPLPAGLVPPWIALGLIAVGVLGFFPLASSFGPLAFFVAATGLASGVAYDVVLKPTPFSILGYVGGFLALITWIWLAAERFTTWFVLVYPAALLVVLTAHLAQSFPDLETDEMLGQRGLAVSLGPHWTVRLILIPYACVALGTLALGAAAHNVPAVLAAALGVLLGTGAARVGGRAVGSIGLRERLFQLIAVGLAVLGIGCVVALSSLK